MIEPTTILYTQNIAGELTLLPRLARLLWNLKRTANGITRIFDLGDACSTTIPLCEWTDGRAVIIVLDAMGYDAIHVNGYLNSNAYEKLTENYLNAVLVNAEQSYTDDQLHFGAHPIPNKLHIPIAPSLVSDAMPALVHLPSLSAGQVGQAVLTIEEAQLVSRYSVFDLSPDVLPEPTIVATLDFVMQEAHYFQKMKERYAKLN